ncbi:MAG: nuclear transport factor 2 family protein [Anaerolineales bacterium]
MTNSNENLIHTYFDAINRRDMETALCVFADEIILHCPGRSRVSGMYHGKQELLSFWQKQMDISGGTFHPNVVGILTSDERIVVLADLTAEREGKTFEWRRSLDYLTRNGRIEEAWVYESDQYLADELFS